jgi:hypothetical protein
MQLTQLIESTKNVVLNNTEDLSAIEKISAGLQNVGDSYSRMSESLASIKEFCASVTNLFKETSYWLTHPGDVLSALQPWFIIGVMVCILLRILGFKTDKWFRLFFVISILIAIF